MSESTSLIPTAVAASGYGSKPAGALQKKDGRGSSRTRVAAGVASACALLGVVAMVASGKTSFYSTLSQQGDPFTLTFDQVLAAKGQTAASIRKSRMEAIELLSQMTVRPQHITGEARASLGKSEYQKCVAPGSKPSGKYEVSDDAEWKNDLVFTENRMTFPAVTAYNDSKALLMGVGLSLIHISEPTRPY